jgi:hypothetical protein
LEGGIMLLTFIATHYTYVQTAMLTDPGVIDIPPLREILDKIETSNIESKSYCQTCMLLKPYRSKHDAQIDRCVEAYDHFCVWTGGPIGRGNHRQFMVFLFSVTTLLFLFMFTTVSFLWKGGYSFGFGLFYQFPALIWCNILQAFCFFLFGSSLIVQQTMNITRGMTVNELINYHRYAYMLKDKEGTLQMTMYDNGFTDNCFDFWKAKTTNPYKIIPSETTRMLAKNMDLNCPEELSIEEISV